MDGRGFQPRPRPLPKALGRGDSKAMIGDLGQLFESLGLILAGGRLRILWERQSFFFSQGYGFGKGRGFQPRPRPLPQSIREG